MMRKHAPKVFGRWREEPEAGFTLLEVLVATAILGTAVAALFGLLSGALGNARKLQGPEQALMLAQSQLNELLVQGQGSDNTGPRLALDQKIQGRWDGQFRWEALATRYRSSPERVPGETILVRIVFDVFWKPGSGEQEKQLSMETYQIWQEPASATP